MIKRSILSMCFAEITYTKIQNDLLKQLSIVILKNISLSGSEGSTSQQPGMFISLLRSWGRCWRKFNNFHIRHLKPLLSTSCAQTLASIVCKVPGWFSVLRSCAKWSSKTVKSSKVASSTQQREVLPSWLSLVSQDLSRSKLQTFAQNQKTRGNQQ